MDIARWSRWNIYLQPQNSTNTPGTRGWSKLRERTLAIQKKRAKIIFFCKKIKITYFFLLISSSYAKILGETNFQPREFPRSGSKASDGKEEKKKRERKKVGNNNGKLRIAKTTSGGARKAA